MNTRQAFDRTRLALGLGVPLLIAASALALPRTASAN
jgi:hypothetical protein